MKNKSCFINLIAGNPDIFSIEHRIFNSATILVSITAFITIIYNYILNNNIYQTIASLICGILFLFCYIYSLKMNKIDILIIPTVIIFHITLIVSLIFTNGIHGSVPYFFFLLITFTSIFIKKIFKFYLLFILVSICTIIVLDYFYNFLFIKYDNKIQEYYDIGISLIICLSINGIITNFIYREYCKEKILNDEILKQTKQDKELIEQTLKEIRILRGLLPICSNCKKIRDTTGSWSQIEEYILKHSEAQFTHGICPDCIKKLYPEIACTDK